MKRRELLEKWWVVPVGAAAGFFAWFGLRSYNILWGKPKVGAPKFEAGPRLQIANLTEFAATSTHKMFEYSRSVGGQTITTPAVLMRTQTPQPGGLTVGGTHLVAFSRICTHLYCECSVIGDPEVASLAYKYRPAQRQAVLGCNCHFSAFDPEQAGKSVSGPALKPLPRLRLVAEGNTLFATGIETVA